MIVDVDHIQTPDELAEIGMVAVRFWVGKYVIKLAHIHNIFPDDIESWAAAGVMDAIRMFKPERGVKFRTYCSPRVHGAILDGMRARSGHRHTTGSKKIDNAVQCLYTEIELDKNEGRPLWLVDILPEFRETTTKELDLQYAIDERLSCMSSTHGIIVRMHFMNGWTMRETADVIGISECRISQIISWEIRPILKELFRDFAPESPCRK